MAAHGVSLFSSRGTVTCCAVSCPTSAVGAWVGCEVEGWGVRAGPSALPTPFPRALSAVGQEQERSHRVS